MSTYYPRARRTGLNVQELPNETLVFDTTNEQANCLNTTAALVWKYADGTRSVAEIAALLMQALHTPVDTVTVWYALEQLSKKHLLQDAPPTPPAYAKMSRRAFLARAGLVGAAVAIPVIVTIVAPLPAQAQSGCLAISDACGSDSQCCSECCVKGFCDDAFSCTA